MTESGLGRYTRSGRAHSTLLALGLVGCAAEPTVVPLGDIAPPRRFEHARDATLLLFPDLELVDEESGWIVSLPRYVGGVDRRRLRAFVHVFSADAAGPRAEIWIEREVFRSRWLFGLLGSDGWTSDGRDADFEERLSYRMSPRTDP
jgi:hypothetical protein